MVWLRFFVACGERRGSDCPRSQPRTGNTKGLRRYPGKVTPPALLTTRSHPHGREKHTQNPRLGQPARPLSGALGLSPSLGRGLRAPFSVEVASAMGPVGTPQRQIV
jgi:hypothetical protein